MSGELNKLATSVLLIILFVLCYKGYRKYQSNILGISVTYEKNDRLQDFTLCPWFYNKNLQIAAITANSGHSVEDVMKTLPSIKSMILTIIKGDLRRSATKGGFKMLYTPYKNSKNILDQSTWLESIRTNEFEPNNLLRCATIQWPKEIKLEKKSYVSLKHVLVLTHFYYKLASFNIPFY